MGPDVSFNAKNEQTMRRAATFGCVALFKAVAKHQRDLKRSLQSVDVDMDVLQKRTMRIEQQSTQRLVDELHNPAKHKMRGAISMLETPNPLKRRRLNEKQNKKQNGNVPKHLESVLMDNDNDSEEKEKETKAKAWRVLDDDLVFNADKTGNDRVDAMAGDDEFDDAFEDDSD